MKAIGRFLVAAAMVVVATSGALADATWKAAVDGDWATASKWSTEAVPLSTERAAIMQQTAGYTVTLGSAQTIRGLTLAGASATLRPVLDVNDALVVDGASLAITNAQLKVNAGGSLELRNTGAVIKQNEDSTGSLWINGGALYATNGFTGIAISSGSAWASRFAKFRMTGGRRIWPSPAVVRRLP